MKSVSDSKPKSIEKIGTYNYRFNYNIEEVEKEDNGETHVQYEFETVDVFAPLTANGITQAVIADKWPSDYEQKIINEYNAAQLGLYDEKTTEAKIAAYKEFLSERAAIKTYIDEECAKAKIQ